MNKKYRCRKIAQFFILFAIFLFLPAIVLAQTWDCYAPQPGHPTSAEKTAFINEMKVYAQEAEATYGTPAAALLAMACNESGYGFTRIAIYANNYFGWKWYSSEAAGGRSYWTLTCQPPSDPNNKYVVFANRRDCVLFVAMKLATMPIYKDDTDLYKADIANGVDVVVAVNTWVEGVQASGYNPSYSWVVITEKMLNNYMTPSYTYSPTYNLYKYSPVIVDQTAPSVAFTAPANGATVSGTVALSATASDNVGVTKVEFYSAGGSYLIGTDTTAPYSINWATSGCVPDGPQTLVAKAYDAAGNFGSNTITVTVNNNGDTTPPTVNITSPANGATVSGTVTINATATDNVGVTKVEFYSAGGGYLIGTDTTAPYSINWATKGNVPDGPQTLVAKAYDAAGNVGAKSITVTVQNADTTPPTVNITSPANGATVRGTVTISATATDNVGVTKVEFYSAGGGYLIGTDTTAPYSINWATKGCVPNGSQTLVVKAYDAAGNIGTKSITVTVKN